MSSALEVLKGTLLAYEVFLRGLGHRKVARLEREARVVAFGAEVAVRRPAVPQEQVARLNTCFYPFASFVLKPLHALGRETIPLVSPGPNAVRLVLKGLVKLLAQQVRTLAGNETAVLGIVGENVYDALEAAEA